MSAVADFPNGAGWIEQEEDERARVRSVRVVWVVAGLFFTALIWALFAHLDEVSTGSGRVVPSMSEQVIQSLDGGILAELPVRQDDVVEPGQVLARLDPTRTESNVEETAARYRAARVRAARLTAEVNGSALTFPEDMQDYPDLIATETQLYTARRRALTEQEAWLRESLTLTRNELQINEALELTGAASNVEVLRLRRQVVDLELQLQDLRAKYMVDAREELSTANAEMEALSSVVRGRTDSLTRLTFRSPVRGVVKNIEVGTIGGVIPPNGKLMDIVPLDDQLMVEARISPRDIAFIHPNQEASVKITAYDYAIYGDLKGHVSSISADTIQDETNPEIHYYRVFIRTDSDALVNDLGREFPITPGMVATVDIHTGGKTVFEYLVKPFNRAREALRER